MLTTLLTLLLPDCDHLHLSTIETDPNQVTLILSITDAHPACPDCGTSALRIHSHYTRTLADLPWAARAVRLRLQVAGFFCDAPSCPRTTFALRVPTIALPRARRTTRLAAAQQELGLVLGGEAGAKLAHTQGMASSPDTLLRLVRRHPAPAGPTPKVLGIDDWALKKGHRYGSILVDLEAHQVVDMLPDREADTVAAWLETHPGVQVISRERAGTYADGAARGAPDAIPVADRLHLFQNMSTTLREVLGQEDIAIQAAFNPTDARFAELGRSQLAARPTPVGLPEPTAGRPEALTGTPSSVMGPSPEPHPAPNRDRRRARYDDVWRLHQQGLSKAAIADALGLHRDTVAKYLGASSFPERQPRSPRPSILDPYKPYLQQRWQEGCQIGAQLFRELRAQGYRGGQAVVQAYVAQYRQDQGLAPKTRRGMPTPPLRRVALRQAVGWVMRRPDDLTDTEQHDLACLQQASPAVTRACALAQDFADMVRARAAEHLDAWLERAAACEIAALGGFATGLRQDYAAVRAALELPWSTGQVEGQINRLKTIKRQAYGRAKFDLLRQRVLLAA